MSIPCDMTLSAHVDPQDLSEIVPKYDDKYFECSEHGNIYKARSAQSRISPKPSNQHAIKVYRVKPYGYGRKLDITKPLLEAMKTSNALLLKGCSNIVPVYGFVIMGPGNLPSPVIPYYGNGDALRYLAQNLKASKHQITIDVAKALEFMHSQDPPVIHGNLKASNVLIGDDGHALLSDIGIDIVISECGFTDVNTLGSCRWAAPEVLRPPEADEGKSLGALVSRKTDVYAFGMTVLEIYTGKKPFPNIHELKIPAIVVLKHKRPSRPLTSDISDELWSLICDCWKEDPMERLSMAEAHERLVESMM